MAWKTVEDYKQEILEITKNAGENGISKTGLKIKTATAREAFTQLKNKGLIANIGSKSKQIWVTSEYHRPLETAYHRIEEKSRSNKTILICRSNLKKGLTGSVGMKADEALKLLKEEGRLVVLTGSGRTFYANADRLRDCLQEESVDFDNIGERVQQVYPKVKADFGFSDVHISKLQKACGVPMEQFKDFLIQESRPGGMIQLGKGDWSLSTEEVRNGAVYIDGTPYLMVRVK